MKQHVHVQRALQIIQSRYSEPLTTGSLARELGVERTYLAQLFRKDTGETIHRTLTRVRISEARALLVSGLKVEAVGLTVGFRSRSAFYRAFASCTGTSPGGYGIGDRRQPS